MISLRQEISPIILKTYAPRGKPEFSGELPVIRSRERSDRMTFFLVRNLGGGRISWLQFTGEKKVT